MRDLYGRYRSMYLKEDRFLSDLPSDWFPFSWSHFLYISKKQDLLFLVTLDKVIIKDVRKMTAINQFWAYSENKEIIQKKVVGKINVSSYLNNYIRNNDPETWGFTWIPEIPINPFYNPETQKSECLTCAKEFSPRYPSVKYCSRRCQEIAFIRRRKDKRSYEKSMEFRRCKQCKSLLPESKRNNAEFCSVKCRVAHHRQQKKILS